MTIKEIQQSAKSTIESCNDLQKLQQIKAEILGKSSLISQAMKALGSMSDEERKTFGAEINSVKQEIQHMFIKHTKILEEKKLHKRFETEKLDLTLPARESKRGSIHPITQCLEELIAVFAKYGFEVKEGPSIDDDWHNFTALNIDENHPARQMHDTFYLQNNNNTKHKQLLRTHTSTVQIHTMKAAKPPFCFIAPGRTYRCDYDMTHTPMFHQIEGLVVDKGINMGHLKYVISDFVRTFFEQPNIEVQFRPSFFPFTEPSAEVDIRMNKSDNWLEVLGCGMVHPNVLKNVDIDPDQYQGFAFGLGIERFAMLKYGIKDLRQFFEGDMRWQKHYGFSSFDIPSLARGLAR